MENLDEALGKLLSDPNAMTQVMNLAQSLGVTAPREEGEKRTDAGLGNLLSQVKGDTRQSELFRALGPYLSQKRREKLEKAMRLARLSSLATIALNQTEHEEPG